MRLYLLGGFRVECAGRTAPNPVWKRKSARSLLKLLALAPDLRLHREQIQEALWPDLDDRCAADSFRHSLQVARRVLEPDLPPKASSSYIQTAGEVVSLVPERIWIDAAHFQSLAIWALSRGDRDLLESAIDAYGGELLPEDRYEDWTSHWRDTLARQYVSLLLRLADVLEGEDAHVAAMERLYEVLACDPAEEEAHRRLIRLHALFGSRHQALRQYQLCVQALKTGLDAEPSPETQALHVQVVHGLLSPAPFRGTPAAPLPAALLRLAATPLVGRKRPLDLLRAELKRAAAGQGGTVLISGEAGIGKSRITVELARDAHDALVLWGASYQEEGVLAYGTWIEAVEGALTRQSAVRRDQLAADYPEIGVLVPSLRRNGRTHVPPVHTEIERARLFAAMVRLLEDLADSQTLLVVLDDLHAADPTSLQLLHHLARAALQRPWLIVGTYREENAAPGGELQSIAARLTRDGLCHHLELLRLARTDCDRLIESVLGEGRVDPSLAERLHTLSLGNPLFLLELARAMREEGHLSLIDGVWYDAGGDEALVPREVRDLVDARVRGMREEARRTVYLAAVAGMEASYATLRQASRLQEADLLDALDDALEGRILEERSGGYAFRHPLFRSALYDRLSAPRRAHLHGVLARSLELTAPEEVESLAHHWARSDDQDRAVLYLEQAGDRARAVYANRVAEGYYREASTRLKALGRAGDEARVREKLAGVLTVTGRYGEALEELDRAAGTYRGANDLDGLVRSTAAVGEVHFRRGTGSEGMVLVQRLFAELDRMDISRIPPASLARLHLTLAALFRADGRHKEQLQAAERASALAGDAGDGRLVAEATVLQSMALLFLGSLEEAQRVQEAILPLAETLGDLEILQRVLAQVAATCDELGQLRASRRYRERALRVAEQTGDAAQIAVSLSNLGGALLWLGEWKEASACFERSIAVFRSLDSSYFAAWPLSGLGGIYKLQGDLAAGRQLTEESLVLAESHAAYEPLAHVRGSLAEIELLDGNPSAALEHVRRFLARPEVADNPAPYVTVAMLPLPRAYLELGDMQAADEASSTVLHRARSGNNLAVLPAALCARGMVLARQGRWHEARQAFEEALPVVRALPIPFWEGWILYEYGCACAVRGDVLEARRLLQDGLAIFLRLGARLYAGRTHEALAALD